MATKFIKNLLITQVILQSVLNNAHSEYNGATQSEALEPVQSNSIPSDSLKNTIELVIRVGNKNYMNLKFQPTKNQTLANANLPVWTADKYDPEFVTVNETKFSVSDAIGHFRTYHDVEKSSAVVFFEKTQTIYGVIGSKYYIVGLPLNLINKIHRVGGNYVKRRNENNRNTADYFESSWNHKEFFSHPVIKRSISPEEDFHHFHGPENDNNEVFYIETFVFVTWDITELYFKANSSSYISTLIIDHIVYFNAIDMMFAKLRLYGINIHINLSGMLIENDREIFESIFSYHYLEYHSSGVYIIPADTIHDAFRRYLKNNHESFAIDSLDLIFLTSGRRGLLMDYDITHGMTYPMDMYAMRQAKYPDEAIPMVAMRFKYDYDQYCVAAHEIGHALQIFQPKYKFNKRKLRIQCNGTTLKKRFSCLKCKDWSIGRIEQSREFIRWNRNRCFLLNYPLSLVDPSEAAAALIAPGHQCYCYGYTSNQLEIPADACAQPLQCNTRDNDDGKLVTTILPLDGTPCGDRGVCWHKECVDLADDETEYW